jgi:hypothetical protein
VVGPADVACAVHHGHHEQPQHRSGDWQQGGTSAVPPSDIFGTWKGAVRTVDKTHTPATITVTTDGDPAKNNWIVGSGGDTPQGGFASLKNEGCGGEARWNVSDLGLTAGHAYRLQFMVHDGDQNRHCAKVRLSASARRRGS